MPVWVRHLLLGPEWAARPRSENADQRIMARLAGTVAAGISALFAVVALLPAASDDRTVVLIAALVPITATAVFQRVGSRLPTWADDVGAMAAATTLTFLMVHGGPLVPTLPAIYLLLGTAEMAMRVAPAATFHVAVLSLSYGTGLVVSDADHAVVRWVCLVGAMLTCGTFVRLLMSTVLTLTYTEKAARAEAERTAVELAAASDEKSRFLARMSHELRTPLNAIIGFADVLRGGYGGDLRAAQVDYVEDIAGAGRQLLALVDDVLDVTQVEEGAITLHCGAFELGALIERSVSTVEAVADRAGVRLETDIRSSTTIEADERRLGQVLLNLLSNAIRFAGEGGTVAVVAAVVDERVTIRVEDTGPGILPEDHGRVFERYQQAEGVRDGTGLGLPLARDLVQAHGGRLEIDARHQGGAAFVCEFPVTTDSGSPTPLAPDATGPNPYEAFTDPGSPANRVLVARAGAWFATCASIFATVVAIAADASWTTRMGFVVGALAAAASAVSLTRSAPTITTLRIEALGVVGAIALNVVCYHADGFRDLAILPFAWLSLTGWSLRHHAFMFPKILLVNVLYGLVLVSVPDDGLAPVRFVTAVFLTVLSAMLARVLVTELAHALSVERRATAEADELRARLETAMRHKSEFMAGMSHELRTPLNAILGFADVLSDGYAGPLDERQQRYVEDIRAAGHQLLDLLNDILDLTKLEARADTISLEPVCARILTDSAVARHEGEAARRSVSIDVSAPDTVPMLGDPRLLGLAIDNLVANAVKFSADRGCVRVVLRSDDVRVHVEVGDDGIGIRPSQLPKIFDPFHQGEAPVPDHARGGTGLGLPLAQAVARAHGGSVDVRSVVGEGSTFTLRVPRRGRWVAAGAERSAAETSEVWA